MSGLLKKFVYDGSDSGKTIYALIMRLGDNYIMDSDKTFKESPTAPAQVFTEKTVDSMLSKIYILIDNTTIWMDGRYMMFIYEQGGEIPAFNTDKKLGSANLLVLHDNVIERRFSSDSI